MTMMDGTEYPCGCVASFVWDGHSPARPADASKRFTRYCEAHTPPELLKARDEAEVKNQNV